MNLLRAVFGTLSAQVAGMSLAGWMDGKTRPIVKQRLQETCRVQVEMDVFDPEATLDEGPTVDIYMEEIAEAYQAANAGRADPCVRNYDSHGHSDANTCEYYIDASGFGEAS